MSGWYQHGDVTLKPVELPQETTDENTNVVEEGEATGHKHVINGIGARILQMAIQNGTARRFLSLPNGGTITHPEHAPIDLPAGQYEIGKVVEMDHIRGNVRNIAD